jgi:transcriptional regulator with XRE-family HTH domain
MSLSGNHPQVAVLINTLKQLFRARGLRYRDIAASLSVTDRTVKRWFSGHGLTMQVAEDLCGLLQMTFLELCELAKHDLDQRPEELSREQEQLLFADLQLALVFMLLSRGWLPAEIQTECHLPEALIISHLVRLEKLRLIDLMPGNKVRLLYGRNIKWRSGGEAGRAFGRGLRQLFVTMDFTKADAVWAAQVMNLSTESLHELRGKFAAMAIELQQTADAERVRSPMKGTWHAILFAAQPFEPAKLGRGSG